MGPVVIAAGATVDGHVVVRQIGEGPFGTVFQAKDVRRGAPVALKLLRRELVSQPLGKTTFGRLLASIKAYSELEHPNLARVLRTVQTPELGAYGIVEELVEGQSFDRLQLTLFAGPSARSIDPGRLARLIALFEQLARAMAWLHARGVVHGNLKPTNVMLVPGEKEPQLKVLDLCWSAIGVARPAPGTESFLAPEQLAGQPPTVLSDQWSVARMLDRAMRAASRDLEPSVESGFPSGLLSAIERALARDPAQRWPQLADFAAELQAARVALGEEPTDRRTRAVKNGAPAASLPPSPAPKDFHEEPATVKVPINPPPLRSLVPGAFTASAAGPGAAGSLAPGPRGGLGSVSPGRGPDALERDTLEPGDRFEGIASEPALVIDSVTLPPDLQQAPGAGGAAAGSKRSRLSPLAIWGAVLLATAVAVVAVTARWSKEKAVGAREVAGAAPAELAEKASPSGGDRSERDEPTPVASEDASTVRQPGPAKVDAEIAEPAPIAPAKAPPGAQPEPAKITRIADVTLEGGEERPAKRKREKGATKVLDAKADAAMARLAALGEPASSATAEDPAEAAPDEAEVNPKRRFEVGCDEGDGAACSSLGALWKNDGSGAESEIKARAAFERACDFGNAEGCHRAAEMWKEGRGGPADADRSAALEAEACKRGRKWSCRSETTTSSSS